jgi:hypothetical protein
MTATTLSRYQQQQVLELSAKNVPIRKIAELLDCDRGQVFRLQKRHNLTVPTPPLAAEALQAIDNGIFRKLRGLQFFCHEPITCNGERCFWDNFPVYRHGRQMPLLKYEQEIVSKFEQSPYHIIMKPVSAGITTLCLYWLVWMATRNDDWKGRSVGIICGPNISLAVKLAKRIRQGMFQQHGTFFDSKETYFTINGVEFEVFPSHHLDAYRSLESPVVTYISEAEMFPSSQINDVRQVSERYISKAGGRPYWIIMESTPGSPLGLFDSLFREENSIYTRTRFDYTVPLAEGMYSQQEIDVALRSPSADRELLCRFSNLTGSTFQTADIERACAYVYDPDYINPSSSRVIACDPAWASSSFGLCVTEARNGRIAVLLAEEHDRQTTENMASYVASLYRKYYPVSKIFFDGSQIDWGRSLVQRLPECHQSVDFDKDKQMYKNNKCEPEINMTIWPVTATETTNKAMLSSVKEYLSEGSIMIDKRFTKLLNSLYTCTDEEGRLLKSQMKNSDVFDCMKMICAYGYQRRQY